MKFQNTRDHPTTFKKENTGYIQRTRIIKRNVINILKENYF